MMFSSRDLGWVVGWIGCLANCLMVSPARAEAARFIQDRFVIGLWVPPQIQGDGEARFRELAEANFTVVVGSAGISPTEQLALCEQFDLKAIIGSAAPASELPEGKACWGYVLMDEPSASAFPELARRDAAVRAARPGRLGYINLFPNYATAAQLGAASYEEYVATFVQVVKPEVLSMDHYPAMRPDLDTRDAYCENLEVLRKHSLQAAIPFWNYFYSMPFNDRLDPTEAQLRWQVFASIAYGAKGVLYFCYWTPGKGGAGAGEFPKGGAILTAEGRRTRHYDEARRINAELKHLGPTLMQLTSTGAYRIQTGKELTSGLKSAGLRSVTCVGSDPASEFIVGTFRHEDGRRAVLIVNQSYSYTAWPTVEFEVASEWIFEVDKTSGRAGRVIDDSPELKGLQLSFGAGDGRLFLLPPAR